MAHIVAVNDGVAGQILEVAYPVIKERNAVIGALLIDVAAQIIAVVRALDYGQVYLKSGYGDPAARSLLTS